MSCNNSILENSNCVKYLGANIDETLSGKVMFEQVVKKINSTLKFLYRQKSFWDENVRKMLAVALIQPRFDYSCNFWYRSVGKVCQNKLQICQNKTIRFVLGLKNREHLEYTHFSKLNWLNVPKRVEYLTLNHMYNISTGNCPGYLQSLVNPKVHKYNTRSGDNAFSLSNVKRAGKISFNYNGSVLWNSLPVEMRNIKSKSSFKIKCKKYLMNSLEKEYSDSFVYY